MVPDRGGAADEPIRVDIGRVRRDVGCRARLAFRDDAGHRDRAPVHE
jgi:hypothetical protein